MPYRTGFGAGKPRRDLPARAAERSRRFARRKPRISRQAEVEAAGARANACLAHVRRLDRKAQSTTPGLSPGSTDLGARLSLSDSHDHDGEEQEFGLQVGLTQTVFDWSRSSRPCSTADKRVAQAETEYQAAKQDLIDPRLPALFRCARCQDNLGVGRRAARQRSRASSSRRTGARSWVDRDHRRAAVAGWLRRVPSRSRSEARGSLSYRPTRQLREIIGEIVQDLASPTEEAAAADARSGERGRVGASGARSRTSRWYRAGLPRRSRRRTSTFSAARGCRR